MFLLIYIDDLIITGNKLAIINQFFIKYLESHSYFLGVQVINMANSLFLSQQKYIYAETITTPIAISIPRTLFDSANLNNTTEYHQVVGNLY